MGIGDRHLENIMMTKDGQLFHIDYGFVLGYEPKVLEVPMMRISSEMINALGGENSKYYEEFKDSCCQYELIPTIMKETCERKLNDIHNFITFNLDK